MSNQGGKRTPAELWSTGLQQNQVPNSLRYAGKATFDAAPAAAEIFLNGESGQRFYLPVSSFVFGRLDIVAWNITDGDSQMAFRTIEFGVQRNAAGTVAFAPTNLSGADGNPIVVRTASPGTETLVVAVDDVNKAFVVNFTGEASKQYNISGLLTYAFAAETMSFSNYIEYTG